MDRLCLSKYFKGVIAKRLSEVEVVPKKSNQHEFNSTSAMKAMLGKEKASFSTKFIYLNDDSAPVKAEGFVTWYDAREKNPLRSEYRLFYKKTVVSDMAQAGDCLFLCKLNYSLLAVFTKTGSMMEKRMNWLFGISPSNEFEKGTLKIHESSAIPTGKYILNLIGIKTDERDDALIKKIREKFNNSIPDISNLSDYTQEISGITPENNDADDALISWMISQTEVIDATKECLSDFRARALSGNIKDKNAYDKLRIGVNGNWYDEALRNHLESILNVRKLKNENYKSPSRLAYIIMPSLTDNSDTGIHAEQQTITVCEHMLSIGQYNIPITRTSLIHLLTMDPGITEEQLNILKAKKVQLVVPRPVQKLYNNINTFWFMSVEELLLLLREKQEGRYGN